jgi:hypothetical protein
MSQYLWETTNLEEREKTKAWLMQIQNFGQLVSWMIAYILGEPANRGISER